MTSPDTSVTASPALPAADTSQPVATPSVAVPFVAAADGTSHPNTPPNATPTTSVVPPGGSGLDTVNGLTPEQEHQLEQALLSNAPLPDWAKPVAQEPAPVPPVEPPLEAVTPPPTLPKPSEKPPTLRVHPVDEKDKEFVDAARQYQQAHGVSYQAAVSAVLAQQQQAQPQTVPSTPPVAPPVPATPPPAMTKGAPALPTTLAEAKALLVDFNVRSGNYDFGDLTQQEHEAFRVELQEHVSALSAIQALEAQKQREQQQASQQDAFAQAWQPYSDQAMRLYPELSDPNSPVSLAFAEIQQAAIDGGDTFAQNPASALSYAHQAALQVGLVPGQSPSPVVTPTSSTHTVSTPQPPRPPMSVPAILGGGASSAPSSAALPTAPTLEQEEARLDALIREARRRGGALP